MLEWKVGDKTVNIDCPEFIFNSWLVRFPVLPNFDESSEFSLIKLYIIYKRYCDFMSDVLHTYHTSSFESVSYCVVERLNSASSLFLGFLCELDVQEYLPKKVSDTLNMDPANKTPLCQYVYDAVKEELDKLKVKLKDLDIEETIYEPTDTDFD